MSTAARDGHPTRRWGRIAWVVLQVLVAATVLGTLVHLFGTGSVTATAAAVTPFTVVSALGLGLVGATAQGFRWRAVAAGLGDEMTARHAVARCLEAALLNAVLPGGLAGDALRAARRGRAGARWTGVTSVVGERLCGTAVVALAATGAALRLGRPDLAGILALVGLGVGVVAGWSMRRLPPRSIAACVGWSVLGWLAFLGLFALAHDGLARAGAVPALPGVDVATLGAATLAGMSIPVNVAGWGPREGAASLAYSLGGLDPATGFTTSVAYGLLALVSTLPGLVPLLAPRTAGDERRGSHEDAPIP
ncbi:lysylphosphatidylglycerol synthase domain-containing protein [Mobilicoccus pelagius]|uniref:Uncharacterized protein n=1 Tax=Mobilicoccus pelagius NBRC 104925 TaxID=1089455 RepID=H5UNY8_9MICO|nr:lysylphosphatidylglycerol synthase domain-containing protein [Mobilicoccus pelagius]GAB47446.1 hypothetical protein MOPEL_011_00280 [Mobilicoccus pelagius NBRC 104925]